MFNSNLENSFHSTTPCSFQCIDDLLYTWKTMLYTQRAALSTQNWDSSTWPGEPPLHLCRHTAPEQSSSHFLHLKMPSASQTQLHAPHHYSCKRRRPNPTFCQLLSKMAFSRRQHGHHWKFSFFLASTFLAPQPHVGSHRLTRKKSSG